MTITVRKITKQTEKDLLLPNEPFNLFGRLVVSRIEDQWIHDTELSAETKTMVFPDEPYTFEAVDKKGFAVGAYQGEMCVGLAIYEYNWNKFLYLMDLKVNSEYRKQGIAAALIQAGKEHAKDLEVKGMYTIAQDNNLGACQFYLKQGFEIGGFNTMDYQHTPQEGKADVYFYRSF